MNALYYLFLTPRQLMDVGAVIGSDVPLFIMGDLCSIRGRGEQVTRLIAARRYHSIWVFSPHVRLNTRQAYEEYDRTGEIFIHQAIRKTKALQNLLELVPDISVSGKGPTAFILDELFWREWMAAWDGDIFLARPVRRHGQIDWEIAP